MTSWRPRERACAEIGSSRDPSRPLSVTAYRAARRVLEERGFLGLVAQGWTSALRASVLDDRTGTSAVFVLTVPRRKQRLPSAGEPPRVNRALTGSRREPDIAPRAREASPEVKTETPEVKSEAARAPRGQPMLPPAGAAPLAAVPENRTEALAAAQVMQERARLLRRISAEHLRHLARPFFAAGWSPRDLLHAIDHDPGGRQHGYTSGVRSPAGWIRSRLAAWFGPDRRPAASASPRPAARSSPTRPPAEPGTRKHELGPRTTRRRPPGRGRCCGRAVSERAVTVVVLPPPHGEAEHDSVALASGARRGRARQWRCRAREMLMRRLAELAERRPSSAAPSRGSR